MLLPDYNELVELRRQTNPLGLAARRKIMMPHLGDRASLHKGRGLDFSEVREYAAGDDIRAIDWRVTARVGKAHTKLFTEERERSVFVVVDVNDYMEFGTRRTFKSVQAARAAAIIAWRAHELKDRVGAVLFGHIPERVRMLRPARSRRSIWDLLKVLCSPGTNRGEVRIEAALAVASPCIPTGSAVFLISDFFNPTREFDKQLGLLAKRCDVSLVKISDPADRDIPSVDEIRFLDDRGFEAVVDTGDREGQKRYRELWGRSEAALADISRKYRLKIAAIGTERDVSTELLNGLGTSVSHRGRRL